MNAQTVGWFLFLALTKNFAIKILFKLPDAHQKATEGSCAEIKCTVSSDIDDSGAYWFWMKNAVWNPSKSCYDAVIIHSTNTTKRPVSPDFANRVKYIGIPSSGWNNNNDPSKKPCNILICDLNKTDSGNYTFRFLGQTQENKWATGAVNLTVIENPCPITFKKPPVAKENDTITLTCSTSSSCHSNPRIEGLPQHAPTASIESPQGKSKSTTVSFKAKWNDDGKQVSCQTQDNEDPYLIRNISLTVQYAPQNTYAKISPTIVKEGESVTLTCSARGNPEPKFEWYKVEQQEIFSEAEWNISSIQESKNGEYYCEAYNNQGRRKSNTVRINVTYKPQVKVTTTSGASVFKEGDAITLKCNVTRSNPQPHTFNWLKNGEVIAQQNEWSVERIRPEDGGSYMCRADNSAGTGTSEQFQITVQYRPRKTTISIGENMKGRVGKPLTFICNADANPTPDTYSWYRYNRNKPINSPQWTSNRTKTNELKLESVQRADEAYYICNATNMIGTGDDSEPMWVEVQYPPTNLNLSMDTEVTEGQRITISCTVDSFPKSDLRLTRIPELNRQFSKIIAASTRSSNTLQHTFIAASTDKGFYTCVATNNEGSVETEKRELVVKYRPKDVKVQASPDLIVTENTSLTLHCESHSVPEVTSVTWMKKIAEKTETIRNTQTINIKSVSPSDSGLYACTASNEIGTEDSQPVEVKVKYAPKHTELSRTVEQQHRDGTTTVTLSCSSHTFPRVSEYSWYRKGEAEEVDINVSHDQNHTVYSNNPGVYYCIAKNEIGQKSSEPVELFVDRGIVKFVVLSLIILLAVFFIFFVYRHRRKKSIRQGTANTPPCFGFLGWWTCARRRSLMDEPVMSEPFRSRDDLLPAQPFRPNAQRRQPRPDSTPASNINSVYCTVNLPVKKLGPAAQQPVRQQGGHTDKESLSYASLHFGNKQKSKETKAEENVIYAKVSKQKPPKKIEQEKLADYENINAAHAAKCPNPLDYDTDTSEDEVEVNYSQVSFKAKAGHQRAGRDSSSDTSSDSSTSDEEETQYSQVKV